MTVLEKIKRCVSLVWDFQEFYGDEDIEDFCSNELDTYSQYNEILDYFKRITELEQENKVLAQNLEDTEIVNKALEKENAELKSENQKWKDEWQEQVQKATDEGYARTLQTIQLNNAKEIIREFVEWATWQGSNCPNFKSIQDKAEQFLSEVNK